MRNHLKLHFVELIAAVLLLGVYSLLFVPAIMYFEILKPIHLIAFSGGIILLNLTYGTVHTWWKHRGAYVPETSEFEDIYGYLEELADEYGTRTPRLVIMDSDVPNAYATDTLPTRPIVTLTSGLIDRLEGREIRAVIAHEMSHINSYDVYFMLFLSSFVNVVERLHYGVKKSLHKTENHGEVILFLPLYLITTINVYIVYSILFFVSRVREYVADEDAASVTAPDNMRSALEAIDTTINTEITETQRQNFQGENALCIAPVKQFKSRFFKTHPSTQSRINKLETLQSEHIEDIEENTEIDPAAEDSDDEAETTTVDDEETLPDTEDSDGQDHDESEEDVAEYPTDLSFRN